MKQEADRLIIKMCHEFAQKYVMSISLYTGTIFREKVSGKPELVVIVIIQRAVVLKDSSMVSSTEDIWQ